MNGSIISLIEENRKLFYNGILRNSFKEIIDSKDINREISKPVASNESSIKEKGIKFLQEIFNE